MLLVRRKPDDIAWQDFLNRSAPTLRPPKPGRDDQPLTEWMSMPGGASTRLERDARAIHTCRSKTRRGEFGCFEKWINPNRAGEPISWSFRGSLRTRSFYLHLINVVASRLLSTPQRSVAPTELLRSQLATIFDKIAAVLGILTISRD